MLAGTGQTSWFLNALREIPAQFRRARRRFLRFSERARSLGGDIRLRRFLPASVIGRTNGSPDGAGFGAEVHPHVICHVNGAIARRCEKDQAVCGTP